MSHTSPLPRLLAAASLALCAAASTVAHAADAFPIANKPVSLILPALGGSTGDRVLRAFADRLTLEWKVPVIVETKAGAGGVIGSHYVARSAPDGHTILLGFSHLLQAPALNQKRPYDTFADFIPIARITDLPLMLLTGDMSLNTLKDYVDKARSGTTKISYGSYGNATTSHIYSELLNMRHNLGAAHAPYRGTPPLLADIMAGHVTTGVVDVGNAMSHLQSGKLRALAITGTKRSPLALGVPTFAEQGYPEIVVPGRYWLFLPAGVAPDTVEKIRAAVHRILKLPQVQEQFLAMGLEPASGEREDVTAAMRADLEYWKKVVQTTGIQATD